MSSNIKHSRDIAFKGICNGYCKSIEKVTQQYCNVLISEGRYSDVNSDPFFVYMCEYLKARGHLYGYWMITISPPYRMTQSMIANLDDAYKLIRCVDTISKYKRFLGELYFTIEQRSPDPNTVYGVHVHILAQDLGIKKSQIIQRLFNCITRKDYWPESTKECIDVRHGNINFLKYLQGEKSDKKKMLKVGVDRSFRSQFFGDYKDRGSCEHIPYEYDLDKLGVHPDLLAQFRESDSQGLDARDIHYYNPAFRPLSQSTDADIELSNGTIL